MGLLDDLEKEFRDAFPAVAGDVKRILSPFEARVAALGNAAIEKESQNTGVNISGASDFNKGSPFTELLINLNDSTFQQGGGKFLDIGGYGLIYRRQGSSPVGRIQVSSVGSISWIYPGCRLKMKFSGLSLKVVAGANPNQGSTQTATAALGVGYASLLVLNQPDVDYLEADSVIPGLNFAPIRLYQSPGAIANNTIFDTGIDVTGFSKLLLFVQSGDGGTISAGTWGWTIQPGAQPQQFENPGGSTGFGASANPVAVANIPAHLVAGGSNYVFPIDISGVTGKLGVFFNITGGTAANWQIANLWALA